MKEAVALQNDLSDLYLWKTQRSYAWTRILNTPFWALYLLLIFIIRKDLDATPFQIACIISINPMMSFFSFYWSAQILKRRDRLIANIVWSGILSHLPFLFVPWIDNPWFFVFASAIYMLFYRGANPAWMEILKINASEEKRKTIFAYGSAFYHVGGAFLAILFGWMLDSYHEAWRWLFPITAIISFCASLMQWNLPIKLKDKLVVEKGVPFSFRQRFQQPLKDAWNLMCSRPDFARFQIGFMLGGGGLMLWKPALPEFFFDVLDLNFKELTLAMTVCKSVSYALTLPLWTRLMSRFDLFSFSAIVTIIAMLFPIGVIAAQLNIIYLYIAYFFYGAMQAGSELSWNLSGPIFSKDEDSSLYTGVNVLTIGMRGCIAPAFGSFLCFWTGPSLTLIFGGVLCLLGTWQMLRSATIQKKSFVLLSLNKMTS